MFLIIAHTLYVWLYVGKGEPAVLDRYVALLGNHLIVSITHYRWHFDSLVTLGFFAYVKLRCIKKIAYKMMTKETCKISLFDIKAEHLVDIVNLIVRLSLICSYFVNTDK